MQAATLAIELQRNQGDLAINLIRERQEELRSERHELLRRAKSDNTLKAYRSDWMHFEEWCTDLGLPALPASADTVSLYLTDLSKTHKPSTLQRRVAAISVAHKAANQAIPTRTAEVLETLKGIRRTIGVAQSQKSAAQVNHIRQAIADIPDSHQGRRDRALLLIGYAGAFRRSELVAIDVKDITFSSDGVKIIVRRSKTDQEGQGQTKAIGYGANAATCPVKALQLWLSKAGIVEGPVFRPVNRHDQVLDRSLTGKAVCLIMKRLAPLLGMDPADVGGHSLRAGHITDLYRKGVPEVEIMKVSGHKSRAVLARYYREADAFAFNHVAAVGL